MPPTKEVVKRDGSRERLDANKIRHRLELLKNDPIIVARFGKLENVNTDYIAMLTEKGAHNGVSTVELDDFSAHIMQPMSFTNPDYGEMAGRVSINNMHKNSIYDLLVNGSASEHLPITKEYIEKNLTLLTYQTLYKNTAADGSPAPLVSPQFLGLILGNSEWIESQIDYLCDYSYGFEALELLKNGYLLIRKNHTSEKVICSERIQHSLMRTAIQVVACPEDPDKIRKMRAQPEAFVRKFTEEEQARIAETYWALSNKYYIHATPTLFNSGSVRPQLSSCYLTTQRKDSLKGLNEWYADYSYMAKFAGGVGSSIHKIRATNSYISKTNGYNRNGIKNWINIAGEYAKSVDQGGGKRPGSHALYLEPWHADIEVFLDMRKSRSKDKNLGISYAIWMPDEFMRCVVKELEIEEVTGQAPKLWYLMCPKTSPDLEKVFDSIHITEWIEELKPEQSNKLQFTSLYRKYVSEGRYTSVVSALDIFRNIVITQIENGTPYLAFKDSINRKTNQNAETHQCSNLCIEINQIVSDKETAVCNLANLNLPKFYDATKPDGIDWDLLRKIVRIAVRNLDRLIDVSFYPIKKAEYSNKLRRPMGLGIQGLADLFVLQGMPYDSEAAMHLDFKITEAMYLEALRTSATIAGTSGKYPSYEGSPASQGLLQPDLWIKEFNESINAHKTNPIRFEMSPEWAEVRSLVTKNGLRNSLLIAFMPTASTYLITGSNPCFEPYSGVVYKRKIKTGEYTMINKLLIRDLEKRGLWTTQIQNAILNSRTGSIAEITEIPKQLRDLYKVAWDMSPKVLAEHALVRAPFIDQSQSLNIFSANPTVKLISQLHTYNWRKCAKTSMYYLRSLAALDAAKVLDASNASKEAPQVPLKTEEPQNSQNSQRDKKIVCTDEICVMCQ